MANQSRRNSAGEEANGGSKDAVPLSGDCERNSRPSRFLGLLQDGLAICSFLGPPAHSQSHPPLCRRNQSGWIGINSVPCVRFGNGLAADGQTEIGPINKT